MVCILILFIKTCILYLYQLTKRMLELKFKFSFDKIKINKYNTIMEDNKYYISKGNNLGQEIDVGPLNDFHYRGTMQGVFNDPAIIGEALFSVNYFTITQQNKEYKEWEMSEAGEEATMSERQQKILSILPKEMLDKVYEYI